MQGRGEKTAGIDDMPTEILRSIILLAGSFSCDDPDLLELRSTQETILACSRVSRKWAAVSLSHKVLWCRFLDFAQDSVPTLRLFLQFTHPCLFNVGHRSAPLVLTWADQGQRDVYGIVGLIHEFRSRIRELHVVWGFGGSFALQDLGEMEVSHLEALTWHDISDPQASTHHLLHVYSHLPEIPFKRLDIRHARILLQPKPCFNSLTALSVYRSPMVNFPGWLDFLRSTPKLRLLAIRSSIRMDGHMPGSLLGSVLELPDLVLLTVGSLTSDEAEYHIPLLAVIRASPLCALQITELPYIRNSQCRVMLRSKIYKLMIQCANPFALELVVDEEGIVLGNVKHPRCALDWVSLGEKRVLSLIQSSGVPLVTMQSHWSSWEDACKIFSQMISYFGKVTYDKVNSFRIALPPEFHIFPPFPELESGGWDPDEWQPDPPPHVEEFGEILDNLLNLLPQVVSIYANEEGATVVQVVISERDEEIICERKAARRRGLDDGQTIRPKVEALLPRLCHFTQYSSKSFLSMMWTMQFIYLRRKSGYPLLTATLPPPVIRSSWQRAQFKKALVLNWPRMGFCQILTGADPPTTASPYYNRFCERT
ncbi:hypothetical protein NMY22_g18827 [Coprinellus aureogranulatus]|nr:hypothetical protein NMY22_g18827 [Coprinellus aureogranulatus]